MQQSPAYAISRRFRNLIVLHAQELAADRLARLCVHETTTHTTAAPVARRGEPGTITLDKTIILFDVFYF
jgi:hypothetical protein